MTMGLFEEVRTKFENRSLLEKIYYKTYKKLIDFKYLIKWGIFKKRHIISIQTLDRDYHDPDTRLLHGCFQIIVDFVEIEKAHRQRSANFYEKKGIKWWLYKNTPWWIENLVFPYRSRELGLDYLNWEMSLPEENVLNEEGNIIEYACAGQAVAAREVRELYLWWKDIYPNRQDPMDRSGLSDFFDKNRSKMLLFRKSSDHPECYESYNTLTEEEEKEYHNLSKLNSQMEAEDLEEEKEMLRRLVNIKETLWT